MATLQHFCGFKNESSFIFWDRNKKDFGDCFKMLCLVTPANILLFCSSLFFARRKLQIANLLGQSSFILSKLQVFICALIFLELIVEVSCSLTVNSYHSPVYFLSCAIVGLAWMSNAFMAWRHRYITILRRCYPTIHVLVILLVFLMTSLELYSVILKARRSRFNSLLIHEYGTICRLILEVIFLSLLLPLVRCLSNRSGLSTDFLTVQSTGIQVSGMQVSSEKDAMLRSASRGTFYSSIQCVSNHLGIGEDGANVISKLTFWWVQRMMKKGYKGELQSTEDLFLLPQSLSTKKLRITFADSFGFLEQETVQESPGNHPRDNSCSSDDGYAPIMFRPGMQKSVSDPNFTSRYQGASVQRHATTSTNSTNFSHFEVPTDKDNKVVDHRTLLNALHHAFGVQYYCIGILKLTGDALSFAGPLLLHALVSFMENHQVSYLLMSQNR